jgi:hypothetical protein
MTIRTWLSAALAVGLLSFSTAPSLADSRRAERYEAPQLSQRTEARASKMEAARIAQSRAGRAVRADPPPAPARVKQAKLEPKPPSNAARQSSSATTRTARARR